MSISSGRAVVQLCPTTAFIPCSHFQCHPRSRSPLAQQVLGGQVSPPARYGHPAPVGHAPPGTEQCMRAGAAQRDRVWWAAPIPLTFSPDKPRSPGSPYRKRME